MIKKLQKEHAVELLKRIYKDSSERTLIIEDGSPSVWKETSIFPKVGECLLILKDIQVPENLRAFISILRDYYARQKDDIRFFFLEEECLSGREPVDVECDLNSLNEIVKFVEDAPNLNTVLFDASFSFALKLHHESFGYFTGKEEICNLLRNNQTLSAVDPIWLSNASNS